MLCWVNTPEGKRIFCPALDLSKSWDLRSAEGAGCSRDGLWGLQSSPAGMQVQQHPQRRLKKSWP